MSLKIDLRRRQASGFTLLEVLVALFIFTIIAIIMTRALHMVFESQQRTEEKAARLAQLQIALLYIEHDLTQTVDRAINNGDGAREASLVGKEHNISFTHGGLTNPLGQLARSTLQRVSLYLDNKHLVRASWQVLDQISTSKADQRQLLDNVSALDFQYVDDKGHDQPTWPPPVKSKPAGLPYAVKISLTLAQWGTITQFYIIPGKAFVTPK